MGSLFSFMISHKKRKKDIRVDLDEEIVAPASFKMLPSNNDIPNTITKYPQSTK